MNVLTRALMLLASALWLCLPGISGIGGENAGGTGVWILPRCVHLGSVNNNAAPRAHIPVPNLNCNFAMQLSSEVGAATATFIEEVSGVPVALPVNGSVVVLPASLLQALLHAPTRTASIVVSDEAQLGYVMTVIVDPVLNKATISVY